MKEFDSEDGRRWSLAQGAAGELTSCSFSYVIDLVVFLNPHVDLLCRLSCPFLLEIPGSPDSTVDPEDLGGPLDRVLSLLRQQVVSIDVDEARLAIGFAEGQKISSGPNEDYEAWEISGPEGFKIVAMPGGDLAIWT